MSGEPVAETARKTLKSLREMLEKAEDSTRKALETAAPKVRKSVGDSMDTAAKGFSSTMKSIDGATGREQLELLKAYRKVLSAQLDFVDSRVKDLEAKKAPANQ